VVAGRARHRHDRLEVLSGARAARARSKRRRRRQWNAGHPTLPELRAAPYGARAGSARRRSDGGAVPHVGAARGVPSGARPRVARGHPRRASRRATTLRSSARPGRARRISRSRSPSCGRTRSSSRASRATRWLTTRSAAATGSCPTNKLEIPYVDGRPLHTRVVYWPRSRRARRGSCPARAAQGGEGASETGGSAAPSATCAERALVRSCLTRERGFAAT
jgi:hypothetical protein